jgi:hypothetical protein
METFFSLVQHGADLPGLSSRRLKGQSAKVQEIRPLFLLDWSNFCSNSGSLRNTPVAVGRASFSEIAPRAQASNENQDNLQSLASNQSC